MSPVNAPPAPSNDQDAREASGHDLGKEYTHNDGNTSSQASDHITTGRPALQRSNSMSYIEAEELGSSILAHHTMLAQLPRPTTQRSNSMAYIEADKLCGNLQRKM